MGSREDYIHLPVPSCISWSRYTRLRATLFMFWNCLGVIVQQNVWSSCQVKNWKEDLKKHWLTKTFLFMCIKTKIVKKLNIELKESTIPWCCVHWLLTTGLDPVQWSPKKRTKLYNSLPNWQTSSLFDWIIPLWFSFYSPKLLQFI